MKSASGFQEALKEIETEETDRLESKQRQALAYFECYKRIQEAASKVAKAKNINLVMRIDRKEASNNGSLSFEQIANAKNATFIYQKSMDLTDEVIEVLQGGAVHDEVSADTADESAPLIAILDVEKVENSLDQTGAVAAEAIAKKIEDAITELSKTYGIDAVVVGDTQGLSADEKLNLNSVESAMNNPLVYHRHLDLSALTVRQLQNQRQANASRR